MPENTVLFLFLSLFLYLSLHLFMSPCLCLLSLCLCFCLFSLSLSLYPSLSLSLSVSVCVCVCLSVFVSDSVSPSEVLEIELRVAGIQARVLPTGLHPHKLRPHWGCAPQSHAPTGPCAAKPRPTDTGPHGSRRHGPRPPLFGRVVCPLYFSSMILHFLIKILFKGIDLKTS